MTSTSPSIIVLLFYVICSYSVSFLSILVGLISQSVHWLIFDSFGRHKKRIKRRIQWTSSQRNDEYNVIIVGTGFSGLGTAIKLNQLGTDNYILIERNAHLGGTWYANQYPGCACDVPSNLYSFSFEPNPKWSYFFGRQPEIRDYLEHCADKYDIRRHIKLDTTVTQLKWLEDQQLWQVTTQSNNNEKIYYSRSVVLGTGPLSNETFPKDIDGIDKFEGEMCHTAKWDKNIDFRNKRVAVIGTGASAIQVVPEIQKMGVQQLLVFQRSPRWIIPRIDRRVSDFEKRLFAYFPTLQRFIRRCIYWSRESDVLSFIYRLPLRHINQRFTQHNLNRQVKDLELRKKLTPAGDFGCKRTLVTSDWYSALQKPNVKLITNRIREITSDSIITHDGDEYPVDVIIWSTGFDIKHFGIPVYGINGCSLTEQWPENIIAYRGVTIPDYPNLFFLLGPNSRIGHTSVIIMLEAQLKYLVEIFVYMNENKVRSISVKQNVFDKYNQWLQYKLRGTVWHLGGCRSRDQNANSNITTIWPDFTWIYRSLLRSFDHENYIIQK